METERSAREIYALLLREFGTPQWMQDDARAGIDDDDAAFAIIQTYGDEREGAGRRKAVEEICGWLRTNHGSWNEQAHMAKQFADAITQFFGGRDGE